MKKEFISMQSTENEKFMDEYAIKLEQILAQ